MQSRHPRVSNWALIAAATVGGGFVGAVVPVVLVASSVGTSGLPNSHEIVWLIAAFSALLGGVSGLAAGLLTGVLAAVAAAATSRLRVRAPIIAATSALVAGGAVHYLASSLVGEDGAFSNSLAAAAGVTAALGMSLLWTVGVRCRFGRARASSPL